MTTTSYAIVDRSGTILSLHAEFMPAGEEWGFDRELVELTQSHCIGDRIEYDAKGREI